MSASANGLSDELVVLKAVPMFVQGFWHALGCYLHFTKDRVYATPLGKMRDGQARRLTAFNLPYDSIDNIQLGNLFQPHSIEITTLGAKGPRRFRSFQFLSNAEEISKSLPILQAIEALNGKLKVR